MGMLPNILTSLRLVLVPVFLWLATRGTTAAAAGALAVFVIAVITDTLDGYYARKHGSMSDLGRFLDPLADKLLVLSAFYWGAVGLGAERVWFNIWLVHLIALREVGITVLRMVHRRQGRQIVTAWAGKWKTVAQMTVLITVLVLETAARVLAAAGRPDDWLRSTPVSVAVGVLFGLAVLLTVLSGVRYLTADARTEPLTGTGGTGA
jgi:CDP-diacylglycerol--glycerol-3-phosphate 3-phosphatidyltransferase